MKVSLLRSSFSPSLRTRDMDGPRETAGMKRRGRRHDEILSYGDGDKGRRGQKEVEYTLQSNQCCIIEELQINIKACSFDLCQPGLKITHTHTLSLLGSTPLRPYTSNSFYLHMSRILVGAARVGDDVEVALVSVCDYEVVNNPSFLIGEEGQGTLWSKTEILMNAANK